MLFGIAFKVMGQLIGLATDAEGMIGLYASPLVPIFFNLM